MNMYDEFIHSLLLSLFIVNPYLIIILYIFNQDMSNPYIVLFY